jgi:trigger factor
LNTLYAENYSVILEKEKDNFTAVGEPALDVENLSETEVVLTAVVPVKPEVTIEKYTGLKIKKFEYNVTDSDVEEEVNKLLARNATTVEVTDRPCKLTDVVNIDFSGSVDGVKFPGGTAEGYDLELGSGSFIPGFEDQVVGMQIGEEKDINVTFPETYQAEDLKGKNAVFAIKLNKITGKELPELNDEFTKKHAGAETVAEYKEKTKARLERDAERRSIDETENSIISEISKYAKAEIPDAMIESEVDRMVQDFSYRLMYQGIKLEDYLTYIGQKMEDFRAQFNDQAKSRVLSQLIVDKIVKEQGLKASQEEIDEKIAEQAKSVEKTAEEYKKTMDPKQVEYIASDIVVTKLFDYLKANNELYAE